MVYALFALFLSPVAMAASPLAKSPVLFHAGERRFIREDIAANTVPAEAWKNFITGHTRFDLPEYRQGLYGAQTFAGTSLYTLYLILGGLEPWTMLVRLKPQCLTDQAIFSEDFLVTEPPEQGGRFSRWYARHRAKYRALESDCLHGGSWEEGAPYDASKADPETQRLTKLCTPALNDFLAENQIKVARDVENDDSWYVRDRDCIAGIGGSADELLDRLLAIPDFVPSFYGDAAVPGSFFAGSTFLFWAVVAEAKRFDPARLARLEKKLDEWIGNENRERLGLNDNADQPALLRLTVRSLRRAIAAKQTAEWQADLGRWLNDTRAQLGKACEGQHGVPAEKKDTCDRAGDQAVKSLFALFAKPAKN